MPDPIEMAQNQMLADICTALNGLRGDMAGLATAIHSVATAVEKLNPKNPHLSHFGL
jgi:hypothetical protein